MLTDVVDRFLEDTDAHDLPWSAPAGAPESLVTERLVFGKGDAALEIAISYSPSGAPRVPDLRRLLQLRQGNRPSKVLLITLYPDGAVAKAATCGITEIPATGLDPDRLGRACAAALAEPNRHDAERTIDRLLSALTAQEPIPGLTNRGLFATHQLRNGVPGSPGWAEAGHAAKPLLGLRGTQLIHALGYGTEPRGSTALLLRHQGTSRSIAVLLQDSETFDRPSPRFGAVSPVSHAISFAARENLPWVIVLRGGQIRLHPVNPTVGVGRKSQGETFTELDLDLLSDDHAAFLHLLFSPTALVPEGSVTEILRASANFAADLGSRLRERVYKQVVPDLAVAIARQMRATSEADLQEAYHRTLMILFRLLFVAYAEDRALLPYGRNRSYDRHALKTFAKMFVDEPKLVFDREATSLWDDMQAVWKAVDSGNTGWDVPAYNGGLFSHDPRTSPSGAALRKTQLTDAEFGPALRALLVDTGPDGTQGPVDFRSLSVREFGTLYEGLLESSLSIASSPLTIDSEGSYVPVGDRNPFKVKTGEVYFHNRSGKRKATGSYFTKSFAVEHLLDAALEPAIKEHLSRVRTLLDSGDDAAAGESFFDFRVADLAMGSGHFLVAAIDRIEARFTGFLGEHPIAAVADELTRLAQAARDALGSSGGAVEVETSSLLRRQIARRCIYGLDLNLMAVELARLAVWIHTFVPGLPMSSLDHGLVQGNSLTGIATLEEVLAILDPSAGPGMVSLFAGPIDDALEHARARLQRVASTLEATKQEVQEAAQSYREATEQSADARALFDTALAVRMGKIDRMATPEEAIAAGTTPVVMQTVEGLLASHFPIRFAEVFLRKRSGFDVIIGNPPWEKVKVEEHQWWGLRFPGLRSMSQKDKNEAIARYKHDRPDLVAEYTAEKEQVEAVKDVLGKGQFPGIRAATDTDLSLAFAWRFWQLLREGGRCGIVLPRSVLAGGAGADLRAEILTNGAFEDVTMLVNSKKWIFGEVHPQYTIGLICLVKGQANARYVSLRGPFMSRQEFDVGIRRKPEKLPAASFSTWSEGAVFPLLPSAESLAVFKRLRAHPRLDEQGGDWLFLPVRDMHTTDNKNLYEFDLTKGARKIPVLAGASFDLWSPDAGEPYAYIDPKTYLAWAQDRRRRQVKLARSVYYGMPPAWAVDRSTLPFYQPRIAFRNVARATDSRTLRCALIPGGVASQETAPFLFRRRGDERGEAYLLGVLSSLPLDWYARRYVEIHLTFTLLNPFPIPRPAADDPLRERVIEIAGRLAAVDGRYRDWAAEVGVPVGSVRTPTEKDDLVSELDAVVALLYGLDRQAVEHIFETFHRGWDYTDRLAATLHHFDSWAAGKAA